MLVPLLEIRSLIPSPFGENALGMLKLPGFSLQDFKITGNSSDEAPAPQIFIPNTVRLPLVASLKKYIFTISKLPIMVAPSPLYSHT